MNAPNFGSSLDLSNLPQTSSSATTACYVVEADETTFEAALGGSMKHPIVVEFYSPRANAQAFSDMLASLANAAEGRYLLVRLNVDTSPGIAQALGIQGVPMLVGALGGQLVPLFQGAKEASEVTAVLDQLLQAAVANGMVGRAKPVEEAPASSEAAGPDPKFAAADAAMEEGDFDAAIAEFDKILAANPSDAVAISGRAGAQLLGRIATKNPEDIVAAVESDPQSIEAQMDAADLELAGGYPDKAFARLLDVVRVTAGDDRNTVRLRLLSLFETVGASDPLVLKARRDLMAALF